MLNSFFVLSLNEINSSFLPLFKVRLNDAG